MKIFDVFRMANANLARNKARSLLTMLAIFVGSFTIILTTGINYGVTNYVDKQVANVGGEGYMEVLKTTEDLAEMEVTISGSGEPVEYDPNAAPIMSAMTEADIETLRSVEGVQSANGQYNISTKYITSAKTDKKYELSATAFPSNRLNMDMVSGRAVDNATSEYEIMLAPGFAEVLGYDDNSVVGQTVTLGVGVTQLKEGAPEKIVPFEVKVVGVQNKSVVGMGRSFVNASAAKEIYTLSLQDVPAEYQPEAKFYFAIVEIDPAATDAQIDEIQARIKDKGFAAMTLADEVGMVLSVFDAITTILLIFGAIALLAASIGIVNTLYMAVQERTREIGLMKAMGLSGGKIFLMFSAEAIMLGFWGSVIGILFAMLARTGINAVAANTFLADLPGFVPVQFSIPALVGVTLLVMAIAFLAGTLPARRAAKQNPIDALRYE
ncbi:MAG: ABC transporter permease [Candidatus Nomurabacteria bacterium]|jgi:putative ABC transport system permease protein|nr:ABC transporter permease [Candidatus Nomurabacteria bacterium]